VNEPIEKVRVLPDRYKMENEAKIADPYTATRPLKWGLVEL